MLAKSLITALALLAASTTLAAADGQRIGQVKTVAGEVAIVREGARVAAKPGDPVYAKDVIETGDKGSVGVTFLDNTVFSAGPNSQLALEQFRIDANGGEMLTEMRRGTLSVVSGDITKKSPGAMKIKTPNAVLAVRGTTFALQVAQ
jgi:hypothetical protein